MHSHHIKELKKITADQSLTIPQKVFFMSKLIQDYIPYIWIVILFEEHFNRIIAENVPKYIEGDYAKFVGDISIPVKKNIYVKMLDELKAGAPIKEIKNKYGWMKSRDGFTDFYTEKEIDEIKQGIKETEKHKVDIPKKLQWLADELKELNYFRTSRTDKFYEYFGVARPLMEDIAEYVGVSFKELGNYDAISIMLEHPQKYNNDFSYGLIDDRYLVSNNKLIDFAESKDTEIKGNVAFKGLVRGIAKIVTHPNDISKVNKGDVLVAQMTFPSFIAAMQKAVAFVTDEGSITCHAAIVAREMKKPCIVGTKNATKVLKDGDLVEVDADKGIVRIIK
jgi:phosphohistidine swiveling domain-containing protein